MAKDPICGMTVNESSPLRADREGQTYYFCSEHCRKKFVEQTRHAESVAPEPATASGGHSHEHGKSEDSSAGHAGHGHSHHLHGAANVKPSAGAKYFCPMCLSSLKRQATVRSAAWRWSAIRLGSHRRRAKRSTPARCIPRFSRIVPVTAPSVACRWSR
jgi:YHS domain-containing protein